MSKYASNFAAFAAFLYSLLIASGNVALAADPSQINIITGSQQAQIATVFGSQFQVRVLDSSNNAISGVSVTFSAPSFSNPPTTASGTFSGNPTVSTDSNGYATAPSFLANTAIGTYPITVLSGSVSTTFQVTNLTGPASSIIASAGFSQTAQVGQQFATALQVKVTDLGGNPVADELVTFTAPASSGASGTFPSGNTTHTNGSGIASVDFVANSNTGTYSVQASAADISGSSVRFSLTNAAGSPTLMVPIAGQNNQSAKILTAFATAFKVKLTDAGGNPAPQIQVLFTAPASGASGSFSGEGIVGSGTTDDTGVATAPTFTANSLSGSYPVTASVVNTNLTATFNVSNYTDTPKFINASAGTPQSASINTAFTPLQVLVTDANGNGVPSASVTFIASASSSGATGTFLTGSSYLATTDSSGHATASVTANGTAGSYSVTASVTGVTTNAVFSLTNVGGAASITAKTGAQSTSIGTMFAAPLKALVLDAASNPVPNVEVTFTIPTSSTEASGNFGGASTITAKTGADGIATTAVPPTANNIVGQFHITASVSGSNGTADFLMTNTQGGPSRITVVAGSDNQSAAVSTDFATPLKVLVADSGGNPVSGVNVTLTAAVGSSGATGTFPGKSPVVVLTTGTDGTVLTAFTANALAGSYKVTAAVTNNSNISPVTLSLTNTAVSVSTITATQGTPQTAPISTSFTKTLKVLVKDGSGNALSGIVVTFAAPTSDASGTFSNSNPATAMTGSDGVAESPIFTANSKVGSYVVLASAGGASAKFSLSNTPGSAANIVAHAGMSQSAQISTAFATALQALVTDAGGNPVSGATVTFAAPSSGASGAFVNGGATAQIKTNASGIATAPTFIANETAGAAYIVSATVSGVSDPANFSLTNTAGRPINPIPVANTSAQSTVVLTQFAHNLTMTVKDAGGNPVPGVTATFRAPPSGVSGTFTGGSTTATVVTDNSGMAAAPTFTANGVSGTYNVLGTVPGSAPPAAFVLTNIANAGLNVVVNANGRDGTFHLSASPDLGGVTSFTITTSGGSASRNFANVTGQHTITLGQLPFGYKLTSSSCTSGSGGGSSLTVSLQSGTTVTCTFTVNFDSDGIRTKTMAVIKGFMQDRADAITSSAPSQTRGEGRFTGSLFGGPVDSDDDDTGPSSPSSSYRTGAASARSASPSYMGLGVGVPWMHRDDNDAPGSASNGANNGLAFSGNSDSSGGGSASGSVSLASLRSAAAQRDADKAQSAGLSAPTVANSPSKFNIWAEANLNYYHSEYGDKRTGSTWIGYVGADCLIAPAVIFGVLSQYDYTSESASGGVGAHGVGWMVGPYTAIKLTPQISFDARGAWGQSTDDVNPFGVYEDGFNTDRTLGSARLSGAWKRGAWRFNPEASFTYFSETQKSFTDKFGVFIPNQTVSLERFEAGPEVGYEFRRSDGTAIEPYVGIKSVYDLSKQKAVTLDGTAVAPDTLRGRVESGVTIKSASGLSLQGSAAYDGIGTQNFRDVQGQLSLRVPLN